MSTTGREIFALKTFADALLLCISEIIREKIFADTANVAGGCAHTQCSNMIISQINDMSPTANIAKISCQKKTKQFSSYGT